MVRICQKVSLGKQTGSMVCQFFGPGKKALAPFSIILLRLCLYIPLERERRLCRQQFPGQPIRVSSHAPPILRSQHFFLQLRRVFKRAGKILQQILQLPDQPQKILMPLFQKQLNFCVKAGIFNRQLLGFGSQFIHQISRRRRIHKTCYLRMLCRTADRTGLSICQLLSKNTCLIGLKQPICLNLIVMRGLQVLP